MHFKKFRHRSREKLCARTYTILMWRLIFIDCSFLSSYCFMPKIWFCSYFKKWGWTIGSSYPGYIIQGQWVLLRIFWISLSEYLLRIFLAHCFMFWIFGQFHKYIFNFFLIFRKTRLCTKIMISRSSTKTIRPVSRLTQMLILVIELYVEILISCHVNVELMLWISILGREINIWKYFFLCGCEAKSPNSLRYYHHRVLHYSQ